MEIIKRIVDCMLYTVFLKKKKKILNSFNTNFKNSMFWLLFSCSDKSVSHLEKQPFSEVMKNRFS